MRHSIKAFVHKGEKYYVTECLHPEGEDLADFDLAPNPSLLVTFELEPVVVAQA